MKHYLLLISFICLLTSSCDEPWCQDCNDPRVYVETTHKIVNESSHSVLLEIYTLEAYYDTSYSQLSIGDSFVSNSSNKYSFLTPHDFIDSVFLRFDDSVHGSFYRFDCYVDSTTLLNPCCMDGWETFQIADDHKVWRFEITDEIHDYFE